jgi:hypothetical protein
MSDSGVIATDPAPDWVRDVARRVRRDGLQPVVELVAAMREHGENAHDEVLWITRSGQLDAILLTRPTWTGEKLAQEIRDWLYGADDEVLECRFNGHELEKIYRRQRGPYKHTRVEQREGGSWIEWTCPHCGTVRTRVVEPDGTMNPPVYYTYKYRSNYKGPAGITKQMCLQELRRRTAEDAAKARARGAAAAKENTTREDTPV